MTNNGLLTKKEALEKIEDILKTFDEEVYEKLNRANINDEKIKALNDSLIESAKKLSYEKLSYKDVSVIFNAFKKRAEAYKLSWLNKPSVEKIGNTEFSDSSSECKGSGSEPVFNGTTEEFKESNDANYKKDRQFFPTDYHSEIESHVFIQNKNNTGTRHNAEIAAGDIPAGNDADIIGESSFYKESTPSLSVIT